MSLKQCGRTACRRFGKLLLFSLGLLLYSYVAAVVFRLLLFRWQSDDVEDDSDPRFERKPFLEASYERCRFAKLVSHAASSSVFLSSDSVSLMENPELISHIRRNVLLDLGAADVVMEYPDFGEEAKSGSSSVSVIAEVTDEKSSSSRDGVTDGGNFPNTAVDPSSGGGFTSKLLVPVFFSRKDVTYHRTYFEAGALDGVFHSTTYYLEKTLGWRGMLAEANPRKITEIMDSSGRSSILAPICLSPERKLCLGTYSVYHPMEAQKRIPNRYSWYGGLQPEPAIVRKMGRGWRVQRTPVDCYPLYSLLLAANLTKLDFLSLDLEGSEPHVLRTLPWDRIEAKVVRLDLHSNDSRADFAVGLLGSLGYKFHAELLRNAYATERDSHIFSKL